MALRNPLEPHLPIDSLTDKPTAKDKSAVSAAVLTEDARVAAEALLGHQFANPQLLQEALTHRSAAGAGHGSNERLEFLGDRVLGLSMALWLTERYPREQEGALGRRLGYLVSEPMLAGIGNEIGLPALLSIAPGEARAGVRDRASVIADAMEALLGAVFLDGGLEPVQAFVRRVFAGAMDAKAEPPRDAKSSLQEWGLARGLALPVYEIVSQDGPSHAPHFVVSVRLAESDARGEAGSRRAAEQAAAQALLEQLKRATDGKAKPGPNSK